MLKKIIEKEFGPVTEKEMEFAMVALTTNLKLNRINYGERTPLYYVLEMLTTYIDTYRRYDKEWESETNRNCA